MRMILAVISVGFASAVLGEGPQVEKPDAPRAATETLNRIFDFVVEKSPSAWESRKGEAGRLSYDISPFLRETDSLSEAARIFGIPPVLVEITSDQLAARGFEWRELPIAKRHRILDYLLLLWDRGDHFYYANIFGRLFGWAEMDSAYRYIKNIAPNDADKQRKDDLAVGRVFFRPGVYAEVVFGSPHVGPGKGRISIVRGEDIIVGPFDNNWNVRGDLWGPEAEGTWAIAMDERAEVAYCLRRFGTLNTTQEPFVLLELMMDQKRCARVETPICSLPNCLAVSGDRHFIAMGTKTGEVLIREGQRQWGSEQVFEADGIRALGFKGQQITAISKHGGVAQRLEKWRILRKPGDHVVSSCAVQPNGAATMLLSDGSVLRASSDETTKLRYRVLLPEDQRDVFNPRGVLLWGENTCVWGDTNNRLTFIDLTAHKSWMVPAKVSMEDPFWGHGDLEVVGAWNDSEVVCRLFIGLFVVRKDETGGIWAPWVKLMAKKGMKPDVNFPVVPPENSVHAKEGDK